MSHSTPFDGPDGDDDSFMDSWITTTISYGNNPYATTNGDTHGTPYTYQGLLRLYATLTDLARWMRASPVASIRYVGHADTWDEITIDGDVAAKDCLLRYKHAGCVLAIASINRDIANLQAELTMEQDAQGSNDSY